MNQSVMTKTEVFRDFNRKIAIEYKKQVEAEVSAIRSIIHIGKLLDEARQYRDSLNPTDGKKLWSSFEKKLGFSPANISKYIKIYKHPVLRLKKYEKKLPASIFSLYELSKVAPKNLEVLLFENSISPTLGRSEIVRLLNRNLAVKKTKQIELFKICVSAEDLQDAYEDKYERVAEVLKDYGINFQDGPQVTKLKRAQINYNKQINAFVMKSAKKFLRECFKQYIETRGIAENKWTAKSRLSFGEKLKKVGFNPDDLSTECCSEIYEVENLYIAGPFDGQKDWNTKLAEWYQNAQDAIRVPKILQSLNKTSIDETDVPAQPSRKRKKLNFTGVKI